MASWGITQPQLSLRIGKWGADDAPDWPEGWVEVGIPEPTTYGIVIAKILPRRRSGNPMRAGHLGSPQRDESPMKGWRVAPLLWAAFVNAQPAAPDSVWIVAQDEEAITLRWPVVEGADYYQVWRDVTVTMGLDAEGNLVELDDPRFVPVPWAKAAPMEGVIVEARVLADGDALKLGVSAVQVVDCVPLEIRYVGGGGYDLSRGAPSRATRGYECAPFAPRHCGELAVQGG